MAKHLRLDPEILVTNYRRDIGALLLFKFLLAFEVYYAVLLTYLQQSGRGAAQLGLLAGIQSTGFLIADVPSSMVADKFGYRPCLIIGGLLQTAGFTLLSLDIHDPPTAVTGTMLFSIGRGFCGSTSDAFAKQIANGHTDIATRLYLTYASHSGFVFGIGEALAALTAGALISTWPGAGPRIAFGLQILISIGLTAVGWMTTQRPRPPKKEQPRLPFRGQAYLWAYIGFGAVIMNATITMVALVQPHLSWVGISPKHITWVIAGIFALTGVFSYLTRPYERLLGKRHVPASLLGCVTLSYCLLCLAPGWAGAVSGILVMYFVMIMLYTTYIHYLMDASPEWGATVSSIMSGLCCVMSLVISPFLGRIAEHHSLPYAWFINLLLHVPAATVLLFLVHRLRPAD